MGWVLSEGVRPSRVLAEAQGTTPKQSSAWTVAGRGVEGALGRGGSEVGAPEKWGKGRGVQEGPVAGWGRRDRREHRGPASPRESIQTLGSPLPTLLLPLFLLSPCPPSTQRRPTHTQPLCLFPLKAPERLVSQRKEMLSPPPQEGQALLPDSHHCN